MSARALIGLAVELYVLETAGLHLLRPIYGADTVERYISLVVSVFSAAGGWIAWRQWYFKAASNYQGLKLALACLIVPVSLVALQAYQDVDHKTVPNIFASRTPQQWDSLRLYISMAILLLPYAIAQAISFSRPLSLVSKRLIFAVHLLALTQTRLPLPTTPWIPQLDGLTLCWALISANVLRLLERRTVARFAVAAFVLAVAIGLQRQYPLLACPSSLTPLGFCRSSIGAWRVLSTTGSITGRISVLEVSQKYRVLKADHSLLGGEWLSGRGRGVSIFMTFYMQTMANRALSQSFEAAARARGGLEFLQIGLGIGTATKALLQPPPNGIDGAKLVNSTGRNWAEFVPTKHVDVVELDPAVVRAAVEHFALPFGSPGAGVAIGAGGEADARLRVTVGDALSTVPRLCAARAARAAGHGYDVISHDVFTGGALAFDLFTLDFFTQLAECGRPGSVIAVNFVASTHSANGKRQLLAVARTLEAAVARIDTAAAVGMQGLPIRRRCQIYVENGVIEGSDNIVFFCRLPDADAAAGSSTNTDGGGGGGEADGQGGGDGVDRVKGEGEGDVADEDWLRPVSSTRASINIEVARQQMSKWRTSLEDLLAAEAAADGLPVYGSSSASNEDTNDNDDIDGGGWSSSTAKAKVEQVTINTEVPILRSTEHDGGRSQKWWLEMDVGAAALHRKFLRDNVLGDDDERGIWRTL